MPALAEPQMSHGVERLPDNVGSMSTLQGEQASRRHGWRALCPGRETALLDAHPAGGFGVSQHPEPLRHPNPSATPAFSVV